MKKTVTIADRDDDIDQIETIRRNKIYKLSQIIGSGVDIKNLNKLPEFWHDITENAKLCGLSEYPISQISQKMTDIQNVRDRFIDAAERFTKEAETLEAELLNIFDTINEQSLSMSPALAAQCENVAFTNNSGEGKIKFSISFPFEEKVNSPSIKFSNNPIPLPDGSAREYDPSIPDDRG